MNELKYFLGADHGGFELKEKIKKKLLGKGLEVEDLGTDSNESVDYPDFAERVARKVVSEKGKGILVCGTGIGMSVAANKVPGAIATLVFDENTAKMSRNHNNSNILCLGARTTDSEKALHLVDVWLSEAFEGEKKEGLRHKKRVEKFSEIEKKFFK